MIGERIGHLRVIASIGVGGMGAVWHAVDELLDRHVALKVIRPELMSRPGLAERFRSEAIVLARLQHPCIAALYGLEKRGDEFVMVMEFVDGETLDHRVAVTGSLPWPEASRITRAVLDALDHAHESGVVHRDIKPANVMITRAGRVKVMDFGIARLVGAQRQTRTGAAVGTPSYMSPEQLLGQEVDGRADVYAVGTLLYELASGHLPFEVEGDYLRMIAQLQQVPAAPSTHNAELPPGLDAIVARALQKEPEDRYATAGEFRHALEELEREHGVLRPYGTPAAGNVTVPGSLSGRGTPAAGTPAIGAQGTPAFITNASALLTPVESAMSVTPVPFAIEPAGATPIDLQVPVSLAGNAEKAAPLREPAVVAPTPEFTSSLPEATAAKKSAVPRLLLAGAAIAAVAVVGVMLSRNVTERETAATVPAPPTPTVVAAPVPVAPPVAPPVVADSSVDSAAIKKLADSVKAAKKARSDSIAKARSDSVKAVNGNLFALPGSESVSAATDAAAVRREATRAAGECVDILNSRDIPRIESIFGGNRKNVVRIARDGKLEVSNPLKPSTEADPDRITVRFEALLKWKAGNTEDRTASASLRAIAERKDGKWSTRRCLIDNDGGARY